MIKNLALAVAVFAAATRPAAAQNLPNRYGNSANSMQLYDQQGGYHGNLNGNQFDPNSVANPYGRYGSPYSPDSINNPYGQYGSPYSGVRPR